MTPEAIQNSLVLHLMANGWSFDPQAEMFVKGSNCVNPSLLLDLIHWPTLVPFWRKAIAEGLIGWEFSICKRPKNAGVRIDIDWEWPDVVTRLGSIT